MVGSVVEYSQENPTNHISGHYNAFLAPGSPCELNIDHNLRNSLAARMTRAVGDDESMLKSLQEVVSLFKEAQTSVFKLMASVSYPAPFILHHILICFFATGFGPQILKRRQISRSPPRT